MKKLRTVITSALLCATMVFTLPAQVIASAEEPEEKQYISEVKVGMGETSEEAAKELLAEGYNILTKDDGSYADLNEKAGTSGLGKVFKKGPTEKVVYMGYKTTTDVTDAITDLAVMNMNGGYSFEDYESLMNKQMDTQIKPFMDRFIATLKEYRENLKKPQNSANYKRADYYRKLLNKLTDDDCGGKPIGDLLVNETKYEMGDEAYNKLSDEEKKNHCDILTLLMQGNGQAVMLMETELAKASDAGDNTWIERFQNLTLDALTESIREENPTLTPSEITAELDKRYNDDAKKILEKWSAFGEVLAGYDESNDKLTEYAEAEDNTNEVKEKIASLDEHTTEEEIVDTGFDVMEAEAKMVDSGNAAENVIVRDYLSAVEYNDGTMLEFFEREPSEIDDKETIRELYPIVEALSGGQIAGLDFLSIRDMVIMAFTTEEGYNAVDFDDVEPGSIYQDVNREVYEVGGVALTNDALRAKANAQDAEKSFALSTTGFVFWISTAAAGVAAAGTAIASATTKVPALTAETAKNFANVIDYKTIQTLQTDISNATSYVEDYARKITETASKSLKEGYAANQVTWSKVIETKQSKLDSALSDATKQLNSKSVICKYLSAGFTVAMAVLAGISIYTTVTELMAYYKVDFAPIPKYIVDEVDITATNEKGEKVMIQNQTAYYKAVLCNRTEGKTDIEKKNFKILGKRNDLNGDVGKQWLALYSVKYENGLPILADSFKVQLGKADLPDGYAAGIHRFGEKAAFNLTSKYYCYDDPNKGTYVFFKNEEATVKELTQTNTANNAATTGSIFSGTSFAIGAAAGILIGIIIAVLIVKARKKKDNAAE